MDSLTGLANSYSEPPSEYVELVDSSGHGATGNSLILVHPDHLRNPGKRYEETRKAFGEYVIVNLKKPFKDEQVGPKQHLAQLR